MFPILCDLDGVVWLTRDPIPGSADAVARLRAAGHRVLFVTNNSSVKVEDQEAALERIGIPAAGDVLTSAMAAAGLLESGSTAYACASAGVVQALEGRGVRIVSAEEVDGGTHPDAVVVGWHRHFDFDGLHRAAAAVRSGARLVATNNDATYPTADGLIPGGGAILAAVETAAGTTATIAGKPFEPMAALVREWLGSGWSTDAVMVGDRPSTDGRFARQLGCRAALVWSGVTAAGAAVEPAPDIECADLAAVADLVLGGGMPASTVLGAE
ncbi:MAG: HAD-IIA family hydrolase [Ilumatobacteraceae bacterium]